jgi:hypothetical protein
MASTACSVRPSSGYLYFRTMYFGNLARTAWRAYVPDEILWSRFRGLREILWRCCGDPLREVFDRFEILAFTCRKRRSVTPVAGRSVDVAARLFQLTPGGETEGRIVNKVDSSQAVALPVSNVLTFHNSSTGVHSSERHVL